MGTALAVEIVYDIDFFTFIVEEIEVARVVCVRVSNKVYLGIAAVNDTVVNLIFLADNQILGVVHRTPTEVNVAGTLSHD